VLGYTCGNDVSERVIQEAEMNMGCLLVGKGFDTFKPLGPVIATDVDPDNIDLTARVNGELKQKTNTSDLIFSAAKLVSYLSDSITLQPGDLIYTGTPGGVGSIHPGDTVEIELSGIGVLRNTVVAEG
jgi:2-keto-4-pentenoate hydratase/2-oxohepta-3-ene-1,7-dioic acid hydratase in catechol pathway